MRNVAVLLALALLGSTTSDRVELARQKRTAYDMRAIAVAAESYATDFNKYPKAKDMADLQALLSPTYIRDLPTIDAWGTPFRYFVSADQERYRLVSAGSDEKFDPSSLVLGKTPAKSDDIVFEDGTFLQAPEGLTPQ